MTGPAALSRRGAVILTCWLIVLAGVEITGAIVIRGAVDRAGRISSDQLATALVSFRPPNRSGMRRDVDSADLGPAKSVRTDPGRCSALTLLTTRLPQDGQSWTGINGRPAQPVTTLTVRFDTAGQARAELRRKRLALLGCTKVSLIFPPFDKPAEPFTVQRRWDNAAFTDRVDYSLRGDNKRYDFYVRRYVNTLTWTYGDPDGRVVRRQVVNDLADRLEALS